MKKAYNLYRVSTKKQVDKEHDDIPMQRVACREFAEAQGWVVCKEFEEKGVSGFKVSAKKRDAIQDLKAAALSGEFEILLVFMFDRIGRIDDETPFVVEWFVKHGIEVWSVKEGEQRFESHVDKLTNYIRFWQASGESEKTSIRIRTRIRQLTLEGCYTGGHVPFGYQRINSDHLNKRGKPISVLAIEPIEAETIRLIFSMTIYKGYGSYRLAEYLNERGVQTHNGNPFRSMTVLRILRNRLYCGYLTAGDVTSEQLQHLKIIELEEFEKAQYILDQRAQVDSEKRNIAFSTKGQALLSGNVYCAHCGGRMTTIRYRDKRLRKDGSVYEVDQIKYCCYHKTRKLCACDGQTTYIAEKIDAAVSDIMHQLFQNIAGTPHEEKLKILMRRHVTVNRAMQKKKRNELEKAKKQLEVLQLEIGNALTGESAYSANDLNQAISKIKEKIDDLEAELSISKNDDLRYKDALKTISSTYSQFRSWAEEFASAPLEQRKMIACQLFKRIELGRDYAIKVELNMTYEQFCKEWNQLNAEDKKAV